MSTTKPDRMQLVLAAHRVATSRLRAHSPELDIPTPQQVCAELWLVGEPLPIEQVVEACRVAGLPLGGVSARPEDPTRELPAARGR